MVVVVQLVAMLLMLLLSEMALKLINHPIELKQSIYCHWSGSIGDW